MDFNAHFGQPRSLAQQPGEPLQLLIVGDFLGKAGAPNKSQPLNLENFESILAKLNPKIEIHGETLSFSSIESFHPDELIQQTKVLGDIYQQYQSIQREGEQSPYLQATLNKRCSTSSTPTEPEPPHPGASNSSFEQLLGANDLAASTTSALQASSTNAITQLIQTALSGATQTSDQAHKNVEAALSALGQILGAELSKYLHDPNFQALEGRWRMLDRLVASIEDDTAVTLQFLPLNTEQWSTWLSTPEAAIQSIGDILEQNPNTHGIIICQRFDCSESEWTLLQQIAASAAARQIPVITSLHSKLIGHPKLPEQFDRSAAARIEHSLWQQLKDKLPLECLRVSFQRILTRLPYGPDTDPIESFDYHEDAQALRSEQLLYTEAPLLLARIWLNSYFETGSTEPPRNTRTIDDLPTYITNDQMTPVAECWLSDESTSKLQAVHLLPITTSKRSGYVSASI